ncbi:MAG: cytochrome D1 domain-containing protein, partial [Pseudomonadales bacterium]
DRVTLTMLTRLLCLAISFGASILSTTVFANDTVVTETYRQHCAQCHGKDRLGAMGPALLPQNLKRLRKPDAIRVIKEGRPATQMPAYGHQLSDGQIEALADHIYTEIKTVPEWGMPEINESHSVFFEHGTLPDEPLYDADMMNLFLVVELGDHHVTVLDGDKLEPIHRFKSHFALHGGPKYSPTGRYVYFASRDGWISKYDLYNLERVAEIRAGINTRNLAISSDGKFVMVANYLPHTLVLLDAESLEPVEIFDVADDDGNTSRVSAVYNAPPRNSFIVALKDVKEVWEIPYPSGDINGSLANTITRIETAGFLDDFFFDPDYKVLVGASRTGDQGMAIDLDSGKEIASIPIAGMPHLGSGITWQWQGRTIIATPNLKEGKVTVIDMETWQVIKEIDTLGPGFFMRSHDNSPYAWVDVFFGPHKDAMHVIDKETLEIVKTLRPSPGKTAAHVEFNKDGTRAIVSIWEMDGEIVIYDADELEEIKRLPMVKPSGKYNVYNKIHYERGTSH